MNTPNSSLISGHKFCQNIEITTAILRVNLPDGGLHGLLSKHLFHKIFELNQV